MIAATFIQLFVSFRQAPYPKAYLAFLYERTKENLIFFRSLLAFASLPGKFFFDETNGVPVF